MPTLRAPSGPYKYVDTAVGVWCHNPQVVTLPDGTYAMTHIGMGAGLSRPLSTTSPCGPCRLPSLRAVVSSVAAGVSGTIGCVQCDHCCGRAGVPNIRNCSTNEVFADPESERGLAGRLVLPVLCTALCARLHCGLLMPSPQTCLSGGGWLVVCGVEW